LSIASTTPTLLELQRYITPRYAAEWRELGVELGLDDSRLRIIRKDNPNSVEDCCNAVFSVWLRKDTTATWKKVLDAVESPAVFGAIGGLDKGSLTAYFMHILCFYSPSNKLVISYYLVRSRGT